jgi:hypothetical protein
VTRGCRSPVGLPCAHAWSAASTSAHVEPVSECPQLGRWLSLVAVCSKGGSHAEFGSRKRTGSKRPHPEISLTEYPLVRTAARANYGQPLRSWWGQPVRRCDRSGIIFTRSIAKAYLRDHERGAIGQRVDIVAARKPCRSGTKCTDALPPDQRDGDI